MREDGGTLGVFSPKKVGSACSLLPGDWFVPLQLPSDPICHSWPVPYTSLFLALKPMGEIPALNLLGANMDRDMWVNVHPPLLACCPPS